MQHSDGESQDGLRWLKRARSNLARAKADRHLPEVLYEDLCFDARQAAEKAIKAVLVYKKIPFPKTHDISEEVSEEDYQQAVDLAVKVVHWAESLIPSIPEAE